MRLRRYILATVLCLLLVLVCAGQALAQTDSGIARVTLTGDETSRVISADTVLDLDGYSIGTLTVDKGATVTLKDTQTDDYDSENGNGYGRITTVVGDVEAAEGYLLVENGEISVHKVELQVSGVSLRTIDLDENGAGMYYQCGFAGDAVVKNYITAYGVAMGADKAPNFREKTYTRNTDLSSWTTGSVFTGNSTLLRGIMRTGNTAAENERNSATVVYCQAYVELPDGSRVTGEAKQLSLRNLVEGTQTLEGVDDRWDMLDTTEQTSARNLYSAFGSVLDTWSVPQIRQGVTGGAYQIHVPEDIKILSVKPAADHILMKNIDMEGVAFTPVPNFTGSFDGNGKTISNLTVDVDSGNYVGMFTQVGASGEIVDLNLVNITVDAMGSDARFVGTIAGLHYGTIENCTVTGTIRHDRVGIESSNVFLGAFVGRAMENSVTKGGTSLSVSKTVSNVNGKLSTHTISGLCAKVKMVVPDSQYTARRLVGNYSHNNNVPTCTFSGDWQDLSFSTEEDSALVQSRRQTAVDAMVEMGTFKWTVPNLNGTSTDPDLIHYGTTDAAKKESHIHTQKFYSGKTYYGIPYDHTSSSYEQAMHYMVQDVNGVYVLSDEAAAAGNTTWGETVKDSFGNSVTKGFTQYIGNDCSGAVAWAWHHAVPRWVGGGGVYVLLSGNMFPTDAAEETYGIYRVGYYTVTDDMVNDEDTMSTTVVTTTNGSGVMYEAYARAQMGDALLYGEPGGHVRMVAQDSVVIRNAKGSIYSSKSYILTHEQGDGLYDRATTNSSWRINYKYTFYELMYGKSRSSGKGYLPVTLKAYHDESVPVMSTAPYEYANITTPASGQVNAGNRILCATVTVKDSAGRVVYEKTAFKGENGLYNAYRSTYLTMILKYYFSDYVDYVESGQTYTFSVDCTVAGGTLNADGTISNTTGNVIKDRVFVAG